jgi:hypothetical protein
MPYLASDLPAGCSRFLQRISVRVEAVAPEMVFRARDQTPVQAPVATLFRGGRYGGDCLGKTRFAQEHRPTLCDVEFFAHQVRSSFGNQRDGELLVQVLGELGLARAWRPVEKHRTAGRFFKYFKMSFGVKRPAVFK